MTWLHDLPRRHAAGSRAILDHDGAAFTYGELCAMADAMAEALSAHGLRPGDRLLLVCENSATYAVACLAAWQIGAWVSPLNARQSEGEIEAIRAHSGARMMLFTPEASPAAAAHADRLGAARIGTLPCGAILATEAQEAQPESVADDPAARIAVLMYTTGTTSAPKGVMLSHANLLYAARTAAEIRGLTPDDEVIAVLPGTHIFCLAAPFLGSLHHGASIRFMPRFSPGAVLDALAEGATILPAVPQMFQALIQEAATRGGAPEAPRLRYISSGGAPLDPAFKERTEAAFGLPLYNGYGLTETTSGVCGTNAGMRRGDVSVGVPFPGVELALEAPDAEGVGELLVRGPGVMRGYYRDPAATAAAMREDGFLRTGDLARQDETGAWHIAGRRKELIIRSGFNVYPAEVETALNTHPSVQRSAVVGRTVEDGNEEIVAFVELRPGAALDADAMQSHLRELLAPYKRPSHIVALSELPTNTNGKVLKRTLKDQALGLTT